MLLTAAPELPVLQLDDALEGLALRRAPSRPATAATAAPAARTPARATARATPTCTAGAAAPAPPSAKWTRERVREAMRRWAELYGLGLAVLRDERAVAAVPVGQRLRNRYGGGAAMSGAGGREPRDQAR